MSPQQGITLLQDWKRSAHSTTSKSVEGRWGHTAAYVVAGSAMKSARTERRMMMLLVGTVVSARSCSALHPCRALLIDHLQNHVHPVQKTRVMHEDRRIGHASVRPL